MCVTVGAQFRCLSINQRRCACSSGTVRAVLCSRPVHETTRDIPPHAPGVYRSRLRWADPYPRAYTHFNRYTRSICNPNRDSHAHSRTLRR